MERNMEQLVEEFNKLTERLSSYMPGSKEYAETFEAIQAIHKLLIEDERIFNDWRDKNRRFDLDVERLEVDRIEATAKARLARLELYGRLIGIGFSIAGAILCIILTGFMEQNSILSQKCFSFIGKLLPKVI